MPGPEEPIRELGHAVPVRPSDEVDPNAGILDEGLSGKEPGLEDLAAELGEELKVEDIFIPVPRREGYELRFKGTLDGELFNKWARASVDRKAVGGIDELKLSLLVIANVNNGIRRHGAMVTADGVELTVRSHGFLDIMKEGRPQDAIRKLFGSDGHVMAAAREVLSELGYGEDLVSAAKDPTVRPSSS